MSIPFSFGPEFQDTILTMMLKDLSFADKCIKHIDPDHLHSDSHKWLFGIIKTNFEETGRAPTRIEIEDVLKREEKHKRRIFNAFSKKIIEMPTMSPDFIRDRLADFAKRTSFADLFQHGQTLYNSGDVDNAYTFVLEAINNLHTISFRDDQMLSIQDFEDHRQKFLADKEAAHDKIPTGIGPLDYILMGGLSRLEGEFGVLMAPLKVGKSIALVHMGFMGLTSLSGRVAHVVLEGSTEQTIFRYQSRLTGIPEYRIRANNLTDAEGKLLELVGKRFMDRLDLIPFNQHWDYTTSDLEAKVNELERKGKKPDLLIVDYADLLKPRESYKDPRHDQREVFRDLKRLSYAKKMATWSATQSQRPKDDPEKETLLRARSVADSYDKIRIADFIGTLNQTPHEKSMGVMRLHADLYRSNECDKTIYLITDFSRMILYTKKYGHKLRDELPSWFLKKRGKK